MRRTWVLVVVLAAAACSGGSPATPPPPVVQHTEAIAIGPSANAGAACRPQHFRLESLPAATRQAKRLVARMSLQQEVALMHGLGENGGHADTVGSTAAIPALKIPALNQEDGPAGVADSDTGVTQLPAPLALAATFDPAAARCYGQVIGSEARGKGIQVVYGPTINMVRLPQWGRAFESYGEDPYLAGTLAAADVDGIQRAGTMAEVKHFAVYNQETFRNTPADDALVDEHALQEIYLKAWHSVVAADPAAIMCSYSTINGTAACQDKSLIRDFLDRQLGFSGFVGSDYNGTDSTVPSAKAGLDQEQPSQVYFGKSLVAAVTSGRLPRAVIDQAATRILTQMYRFRMFTDYATAHPHRNVATSSDTAVARTVAEQSTVLLKNTGGQLPLSRSGSIAVIGLAASTGTTSAGGGTTNVDSPGTVTPLQGLKSAAPKATITYTPGLPDPTTFTAIPSSALSPAFPLTGTLKPFSGTLTIAQAGTYVFALNTSSAYQPVGLAVDGAPLLSNPGAPPTRIYSASVYLSAGTHRLTTTGPTAQLSWAPPSVLIPKIAAAARAAAQADTAVVVVSDPQESEAADRATLALPSAQNSLIDAVAAANKHTVVIIEAGAAVTMPWLSQVPAVLDQWYAGETDGTSLAAVLFGSVDPSGHLPVTFPTSLAQTPASTPAQFPGVDGKVHYTEGVNIGYRWWIDTDHQPLFPFGFGLSYTSFKYATPTVSVSTVGGQPVVTVHETVTNAGHVAGADVAQVYLGLPAASGEPARQLEGYQRVSLAPGASAQVSFTLRGLQLAAFTGGHWQIPAGTDHVYVGDSSATAQLSAPVAVQLPRGYVVAGH
jgi:beta-glucosidase